MIKVSRRECMKDINKYLYKYQDKTTNFDIRYTFKNTLLLKFPKPMDIVCVIRIKYICIIKLLLNSKTYYVG